MYYGSYVNENHSFYSCLLFSLPSLSSSHPSSYSLYFLYFHNTLSAWHSKQFRYTSFIILYIFSYIILFHLFIIIIIVYIILFMFIYLFISSHHILIPFWGLERLSQWIRMVGSPPVIHTPFNFSRKFPLCIFNFNVLHLYIWIRLVGSPPVIRIYNISYLYNIIDIVLLQYYVI